MRILEHKNTFTKVYTSNLSEEVFIIKNVENTVCWSCLIEYINGEKIDWTFYEKDLQKANQTEFRIEKEVIKQKGDRSYVQRKGYDNSFNRWIDEKEIV